jgi:hypothetical protein
MIFNSNMSKKPGAVRSVQTRRFVMLTRSRWSEPPRLRHQVAQLLIEHGHEVLFGEKPSSAFSSRAAQTTSEHAGLSLFSYSELVHHKLRGIVPLRWANSAWASQSLRRSVASLDLSESDLILNFSYDCCFIRRVFARNPVVTVINDDFISTAPALLKPGLYRMQDLTCMASDAVLCTSPLLTVRLGAGPSPELFLPWASTSYARPPAGRRRNTLLYWGYLGRRLDLDLIRNIAAWCMSEMPDVRIRFIGPVEAGTSCLDALGRLTNVDILPAASLDELQLDDVFASFVPYKSGIPDIDAIVYPNKFFQLLSKGTPFIISGMPGFAREPFVYRVCGESRTEDIAAIAAARSSFDSRQDFIEAFLAAHGPAQRYAQLMQVVARAVAPGASTRREVS